MMNATIIMTANMTNATMANATANATANITNATVNMTNVTSVNLPSMNIGMIILIIYLLLIIKSKGGNGNHNWTVINNKNEKNDKKNDKKNENALDMVIGLKSVKAEIEYYLDFIKNKEKYLKWNVKLPKGILLAGPPGTGKTLLIKAISKKLDIPLITASGSEFVEKYVGVGSSRVRSLFKKAKDEKECIVFIDEIDAVGRQRGFDNNSERASTVNQLLVEMDGFDESTNIIVFAATNLVKILDSALTRSGRFDKKVYFDLPNKDERIEMYKLYFKDMNIPSNLSFEVLSDRTAGVSGADIANIANQSKINAIQNNNTEKELTEDDIQKAIDEVIIGREKRERMMTKEERERVSYHEAGHCLMGYLLKHTEQPVKVSIIPRGESALGFSQQKATNKKLMTYDEILCRISVLLGGRCGEKIIYKNISTGASDDIEKISMLVKNYSLVWGMNKNIGPLNPNVMGVIGKNMSNDIMDNCKELIDNIEKQTLETLEKYKPYMTKIAKMLLKDETITYKQIKSLVPDKLCNSCEINI